MSVDSSSPSSPSASSSEDASPSSDKASSAKAPKKRKGGFVRRVVFLALESLAVVLTIALIGAGILAWRMSQGPVDARFLLPHIQKALNNVQGQMHVSIEGLNLEWHSWSSPLGLEATGIELRNEAGPFMTIEEADLDVSISDILRSDIRFKKGVISGVSAKVEKRLDGSVRLFNEDDNTYGPKARTTPLTVSKIMRNLPPIYSLTITQAEISYRDLASGYEQDFTDAEFNVEQKSLAGDVNDVNGYLRMSLHEDQVQDMVTLDFLYDAAAAELELSGTVGRTNITRILEHAGIGGYLEEQSLNVDIPVQARGMLVLSDDWHILNMNVMAETEHGEIRADILPDDVLNLSGVSLNLSYDPRKKSLSLYETSFAVADIDFIVSANIDLPDMKVPEPTIHGRFDVRMPELQADRLDEIVPKSLDHEPLYKWLVHKISDGRFINFALGGEVSGWQVSADNEDGAAAPSLQDDPYSRIMDVDGVMVPVPVGKPDWDSIMQAELQAQTMLNMGDLYGGAMDGNMRWVWSSNNVEAHFEFDDLSVDYKQPMMPAEDVVGSGHMVGKALTLDISSARLGGMQVQSGRLYFDDLITKGEGDADIDVKVSSSVKDAIDYLAREPINFGKHLKFDKNRVSGQADMDVQVNFPTVKDLPIEAVKVAVEGTIYDAVLPGVLKGMSLTEGPFKIAATEQDYRMTGKGRLDGRPIDLNWHSYFSKGKGRPYESRIQASFVADAAFRQKIGVNIDDFLTGDLPVDIDLREEWGARSVLDVTGRLNGARLRLEPFEYETSADNVGELSLQAVLVNDKLSTLNNLQIKSDELTLHDGDLQFKHDMAGGGMRLEKGDIDRLMFAENDFAALLQESTEGLMKVALNGAQVDARIFLSPEGVNGDAAAKTDEAQKPFEVGLNVNRLLTNDEFFIRNVEAYVKGKAGRLDQLEVDAVVGKGTLYLRYKPNMEDRYSLRIEADDAGAMLKAFGVTDKVTGGKLTVAGLPLQRGYYGDVRGLARIDDFNVRAAPALANLIKLVDLPTVMSSLNKDGLSFARLETEFEWRNRRGGGTINFKDGRTSGGSMGLTFEGDINKTLNRVAINGTIVPASTLNSFFSGIPLVGEILSGGSGSIFAATYTMSGNADEPKISVNPLSVLAPGLLRRLLFEGGD